MAENTDYVMTKPGMMIFPKVLEAEAYRPKKGQPAAADAKKSFSCGFCLDLDHPDVAPLKTLILQVAKTEWPALDINAAVKANVFHIPFAYGNKLIEARTAVLAAGGKEPDGKYDFQKDKIIFNSSTGEKYPPALGVRTKQGDIDLSPDNQGLHKNAFYTGCLGLGVFNVKPYTISATNKGVKLYLTTVHSLNSGARIQVGGRSASETFKGVAGSAVAENPEAGMDEEVPF